MRKKLLACFIASTLAVAAISTVNMYSNVSASESYDDYDDDGSESRDDEDDATDDTAAQSDDSKTPDTNRTDDSITLPDRTGTDDTKKSSTDEEDEDEDDDAKPDTSSTSSKPKALEHNVIPGKDVTIPSVKNPNEIEVDKNVKITTDVNGEEMTVIESTIDGAYDAKSIDGCAILTKQSDIMKAYGLTEEYTLYAKCSDLTENYAPASTSLLTLTASSQGAKLGPMFNIAVGKVKNGKFSHLEDDKMKVDVIIGVPNYLVTPGCTFALASVRADGSVDVLMDEDNNVNTITTSIMTGNGNYAIIRY